MSDFIEVFPNWLSELECLRLIDKFTHHAGRHPGQTGNGLDLSKKQSTDLTISNFDDWRNEVQFIYQKTLDGIVKYVRKYPYFLVGPVALNIPDEKNPQKTRSLTIEDIEQLSDDTLAQLITHIYTPGSINLQHYKKQSGGYYYYHSEVYPHPTDKQNRSQHRTLLFMYYLNTVEKGGETEFYFQQKKLPPRRGDFVLAPAVFTHTHRGNIPESEDKYILTSWVEFKSSAEIYGR